MKENEYELVGNSNDNFIVNENNSFQAIRLFAEENGADIALELTSFDNKDNHIFLQKFLDKKIKIKISIINE